MVRIWAKVMKNEKIVKDTVYEDASIFDIYKFFDYLTPICEKLDIATPIVVTKHLAHFLQFRNTTFMPSDFPESVNFDKLVLENMST